MNERNGLGGGRLIQVVHHHARAIARQPQRNLLANALRHASSADGAVRLEVRAATTDGKVELRVIDDGPGVDDVSRGQVFEPFFTTHGAGTGLGLYIARELCEASGASLELLDAGPGAHFRIRAEGRICR